MMVFLKCFFLRFSLQYICMYHFIMKIIKTTSLYVVNQRSLEKKKGQLYLPQVFLLP